MEVKAYHLYTESGQNIEQQMDGTYSTQGKIRN